MADAIFARVVEPWRMPVESEIPADLAPYWPRGWLGARMRVGRVLGIPAWMWPWLRRTQGDYLERCFVRDTFRGREYLRGVPCPSSVQAAPRGEARTVLPMPEQKNDPRIVRRCGCGRTPPGAKA